MPITIFIVIFSKRVPKRSTMANKLYFVLKEAIAIMNDIIHFMTSVIVKLRESAVGSEVQFAEVEKKSSSEVSDGGHGR